VTTLMVGIASYEERKVRTMAVARGGRRVSSGEAEGLARLSHRRYERARICGGRALFECNF